MSSFIRQVLLGCKKEKNAWFRTRRRPRKKTPVSTRQWLVLSFGIAAVVGVIFILALYYQPGK
jgi:hypothetical protein